MHIAILTFEGCNEIDFQVMTRAREKCHAR